MPFTCGRKQKSLPDWQNYIERIACFLHHPHLHPVHPCKENWPIVDKVFPKPGRSQNQACHQSPDFVPCPQVFLSFIHARAVSCILWSSLVSERVRLDSHEKGPNFKKCAKPFSAKMRLSSSLSRPPVTPSVLVSNPAWSLNCSFPRSHEGTHLASRIWERGGVKQKKVQESLTFNLPNPLNLQTRITLLNAIKLPFCPVQRWPQDSTSHLWS